ncbi:hypothetical protein PFTANZ_06007, partial [Plasmodium falciparum Tanzania (2000708)]
MVPPVRPSSGGDGSSGGDDIEDESAKHLLDSIGKKVHEEIVKTEDNQYKEALKGDLNTANNSSGERGGTTDTCTLVKQYYDGVNKSGGGKGERYPCKGLSGIKVERFSDKIGGQCTDSKIKGNKYIKGKDCGACAPYRRLHLCHHNLESIHTKSMTTHDLLLEVCMAAYYEGDSIRDYYTKHERTNEVTSSQLCTVLARSFADIGDIVRGKDLFLGNDEEKKKRKQLQDSLKKIFAKIHEGLSRTNVDKAKARYGSDPYFFKLREDWWALNREEVWKAITCDVKSGNNYFRRTCGDNEKTATQAKKQCRCDDDQVPTYFDYVPQYLRWFEEWAEDFCRLRKHKLENAKKQCRGKNGEHKYCDLNRYDCEKTIRGDHDFVEKDDCKGCQYSCSRFVNWIDNQKLEFLKQKEKYTKEITGGGSCGGRRKKGSSSSSSSYDNGYEKKFYNILKNKGGYNNVDEFLDLLNNETTCTKKLNDQGEEEGTINFKTVNSGSAKKGDDSNKTFYRTKYCEACPWCGAEQESGGGWKDREDTKCDPGNKYADYENTEIQILTGDKTKSEIVERYTKFCKNNGEKGATAPTPNATSGENGENGKNGDNITETWECYYKKKNENNDGKGNNDDINFCVLQDGKQHTKDQKDKSYNAFFWDWVHDMLIDSIKWRNEHGKCINNNTNGKTCKRGCNTKCECFQKWVGQKQTEWDKIKDHFKTQNFVSTGPLGQFDYDFVLNYLLDKKELLQNIKDTHADAKEDEIKNIDKMLQETGVGGGGSGVSGIGANGKHNTKIDKFLEKELKDATECKNCQEPPPKQQTDGAPGAALKPEEKEEDEDDEENDDDEDEPETKAAKEEDKVCEMVKKFIRDNHGNNDVGECKGKEKYPGWNCDENDTLINIEHKGACMPPRRQKLCLYYLAHEKETKNIETQDHLRDAFIKTAAAETFLSWHYYKSKNGDAEQKLKEGIIPPEFLRSMIYTFGDYRDICMDTDISVKTAGSDITKAKNTIDRIFKPTGGTEEHKRKQWWQANGPDIWKGMVCALTHKTDDPKEVDEKVKKAFFGKDDKNPGTFESKYQYNKVTFSGDKTTTLEKFAQTPQFLRWFTEWGEHFCKEHKKELETLKGKCDKCDVQDGTCGKECDACKKKCKEYEGWLQTWKGHYNKQKQRYTEVKGTPPYKNDKDVIDSTEAYEYLYKQLKNMTCTNGNSEPCNYNCMENALKKQKQLPNGSNDMPASLEYPPIGYKEKCTCTDKPPEPPAPPAPAGPQVNVCETVKNALTGSLNAACEQKYGYPQRHWGWKCVTPTGSGSTATSSGNGDRSKRGVVTTTTSSDSGSICVPPRRRKLYVTPLTKLTGDNTAASQEKAYTEQREKAQKNNGGNEFSTTIAKYNDAAAFLNRLKNGPCSKNNSGDDKKGEDEIKFDDDTFKHAENCGTCSEFKVKCNGSGKCIGGGTQVKCNGGTITADDIKNEGNFTEPVDMRVSDSNKTGFDDLKDCENAHIFKGIRKD